ncbi:ionotropic receptor 75a-like [Choristoneura fumiferana]|uniref:ionotropic receptor 75a-like n=1 Tax=Choristoneura fumiferana TaxID=7141 RepID=UPI003D15F027
MVTMNETFTVASISDCDTVLRSKACDDDYMWRETKVGCKVLLLLQEMLQFNFGFTLLRSDPDVSNFYSQPFTTTVWHCLFAMILLVSSLFYLLNRAEQRLLGSKLECYISHELLITIGAYCQHYLPVNPMELTSRRIAFFSFFLFTYVIYSYYTSTLLSDLVHDSDNVMNLQMLVDSSYDNVVLDKVALVMQVLIQQRDQMNSEIRNYVQRKFAHIRVVNITEGLEEVRTGKTALLSDYTSLYPVMKQIYDKDIICDLLQVDLFSNFIKYFFTSKNFKYTEEFKISILRAKETGVLPRLLTNHVVFPSECRLSHFQAQFGHVQMPLTVLACSYILCLFILLGERIYFQRNKVWPYVE